MIRTDGKEVSSASWSDRPSGRLKSGRIIQYALGKLRAEDC